MAKSFSNVEIAKEVNISNANDRNPIKIIKMRNKSINL